MWFCLMEVKQLNGHYLQMAYHLSVLSSVMFVSVSLFASYLRDWDIHLATHLGTDA